MINFAVGERTAPGYLALPAAGKGRGVLVLHAWWGLTEPFRGVCDRLAQEGFVALAPDLYHGKTTDSPDEAGPLSDALDHDAARWRSDISGGIKELHRYEGGSAGESRGVALVGFSMGAAYALDMSANLPEEIPAVVTFYVAWAGPDFGRARAAYLCHYAENDPFEEPGAAAEMEQSMRAAGRQVASYRYPGTKHWFVEDNRPEYDAAAAGLAWRRTLAFLHEHLG